MTKANYLRASTALLLAIVAAVLVAVMVSYANPASAQSTTAVAGTTIKVTTKEDESNTDGDCSLREAIEAANTNLAVDECAAGSATEEDAIYFALGEKAKIVLSSQLPTITDPSGLTIDGRKAKITVSGNDAVRVFEVGPGAEVNLRNLKVAHGKSGDFGGGIFNFGTLTVTNSTFSGNSSTQLGGGAIRNQEQLGPFPGDSGTVTLSNTIVANSPSGGNCGGSIIDGGFNIDDGTTCGFSAANFSKPSTDPRLGLLANNGGPTKTHALLKGSPAIDAIPDGTNGCGTMIATDQREVKRPQGGRCDIGAYEKKVRRR
jgi:CSLREA domain-containing protein